jgi:hypothetical protein
LIIEALSINCNELFRIIEAPCIDYQDVCFMWSCQTDIEKRVRLGFRRDQFHLPTKSVLLLLVLDGSPRAHQSHLKAYRGCENGQFPYFAPTIFDIQRTSNNYQDVCFMWSCQKDIEERVRLGFRRDQFHLPTKSVLLLLVLDGSPRAHQSHFKAYRIHVRVRV